MTPEELKAKLVKGAIVSFDTNAGMDRSVLDAARYLERIGVRVELSVIMVGEAIRRMAVRNLTLPDGRKKDFKAEELLKSLKNANITVLPIREEDALSFCTMAMALGDWDQVKREAIQKMLAVELVERPEERLRGVLEAAKSAPTSAVAIEQLRVLLGLPHDRHGLLLPSLGKYRKFPATADWWIRAQAECRGWIFVTNDQGNEWADLPQKVTRKHFDAVLAEVVPKVEL
jgi:hypothetical protein